MAWGNGGAALRRTFRLPRGADEPGAARSPTARPFWRIFVGNGVIFAVGLTVPALSPATVSSPVLPAELPVLSGGLALMLGSAPDYHWLFDSMPDFHLRLGFVVLVWLVPQGSVLLGESRALLSEAVTVGFRRVVAYLPENMSTWGLGMIGRVFADRTHLGLPPFEVTAAAETPGPVRTDLGLTQHIEHGLDRLAQADLIVLLPGDERTSDPSPEVVAALWAAHHRGTIIAAFCAGTYLLAAAGLLDGLRATTHWSLAADLAARFPKVTVTPEPLYVDEGLLLTGAGGISGLDMILHLLRREHGSAVANAIAREVVASAHRVGGQAQYIPSPVPVRSDDEGIAAVIDWAEQNLRRPLSVNELAARALMSPRTFARRFKEATGTTPHAWLLTQRLNRAEELLETTLLGIEEIAQQVGYRNATVLREQFVKRRGIPPRTYRSIFNGHYAQPDAQ
ncbi:GlxA family transcriptional regulator [Actinomadura sp. 9N407]|uniref:GlxA family transcriptional regulator n=1 Tax=Actinomadura sp. 9N407 TaxID=3375154 RepID=UPI0037911970